MAENAETAVHEAGETVLVPSFLLSAVKNIPLPERQPGVWETTLTHLLYHDRWNGLTVIVSPAGGEAWTAEVYDIHHRGDDLWPLIYSAESFVLQSAVTRAVEETPDYCSEFSLPIPSHPSDDAGSVVLRQLKREIRFVTLRYLFRDLHARVPDLFVEDVGGGAPYQADGVWCGYTFRFHYRRGQAELHVGTDLNEGPYRYSIDYSDNGNYPRWSATTMYGNEYSGVLTNTEFIYLFCLLGNQIAPAPYKYTFAMKDNAQSDLFDHTHPLLPSRRCEGETMEAARKEAYRREIEYYAEEGKKPPFKEEDLLSDDADLRVFPTMPSFTVYSIPPLPPARDPNERIA